MNGRRGLRCVFVAGLCLIACLGLVGCAGSTDSPPDSSVNVRWKAEIDQVLALPSATDLERQVFADYRVSDAEYAEAQAMFIQCMAEQGWTTRWDASDNTYVTSATPGGGHEGTGVPNDVWEACDSVTLNWIELVYFEMARNPDKLSWPELVRRCFVKYGVADADGLTDEQLSQMLLGGPLAASQVWGSPEAEACAADPYAADTVIASMRAAQSGVSDTTPGGR